MNRSRERNVTSNPDSPPGNPTHPPQLHSARGILKHESDGLRHTRKDKWSFELDRHREFRHIFGEIPKNATYDTISDILAGYHEIRRRTSEANLIDPRVDQHALDTEGDCTCVLCLEYDQLALAVSQYLEIERRLTLEIDTEARTRGPRPSPSPRPS